MKTDFRNISENKGFRRKSGSKCPICHLFLKKPLYLHVCITIHIYQRFIVKIKVPTHFLLLQINVPSEMCQKVVSLMFENSLKYNIFHICYIFHIFQKMSLYITSQI